jgi:hypothetical protein
MADTSASVNVLPRESFVELFPAGEKLDRSVAGGRLACGSTKAILLAAAGALILTVGALGTGAVLSVSSLDRNQKVYIQNAPVLGDGAGEAALNVCTNFDPDLINNPDAPNVRVCGNGIKATIYLGDHGRRLNEYWEPNPAHHEDAHYEEAHHGAGGCSEDYEFKWTVGQCDSTMPSTTCETMGPSQDKRIAAAQSYIIEQC